MVNGGMLESHANRLIPNTTDLWAVKCKRTDGRVPLLFITVSVSGAWSVTYRELYGGTLYNTAET